ncbi:hypothetical protein HDU96_004059 [Phlyctochytrium bullatum]|nr:hypothetical protein HDU96_004059 [Phlyctochytrium bullatum]
MIKYGARVPGAWAVVTGASDGIGKEFALQLSRAGFNVFLVSRTRSKLEAVAKECEALGSSNNKSEPLETAVYEFDFATASDADYKKLLERIQEITADGGFVGVLVNNVGTNHDIPTPFLEESDVVCDNIVRVNILAQMKLTKLLAPQMIADNKSKVGGIAKKLILNIGSVAGTVPSGLLSVYSASKSFLRYWSIALGKELKSSGVHVEHVTTYFVTTAMSKIRRATFTTPTPRAFVASVLKKTGRELDSTPYPAHGLLMWVLNTFTTEGMRVDYSHNLHVSIRKRALRKREKLAAAKKD